MSESNNSKKKEKRKSLERRRSYGAIPGFFKLDGSGKKSLDTIEKSEKTKKSEKEKKLIRSSSGEKIAKRDSKENGQPMLQKIASGLKLKGGSNEPVIVTQNPLLAALQVKEEKRRRRERRRQIRKEREKRSRLRAESDTEYVETRCRTHITQLHHQRKRLSLDIGRDRSSTFEVIQANAEKYSSDRKRIPLSTLSSRKAYSLPRNMASTPYNPRKAHSLPRNVGSNVEDKRPSVVLLALSQKYGAPVPQLEKISLWLQNNSVPDFYLETFVSQGFDSMTNLCFLEKDDLVAMGLLSSEQLLDNSNSPVAKILKWVEEHRPPNYDELMHESGQMEGSKVISLVLSNDSQISHNNEHNTDNNTTHCNTSNETDLSHEEQSIIKKS